MNDLVVARNCCMVRIFSRRSRVGVGMNRSAGGANSVKRSDWILHYIKSTKLNISDLICRLLAMSLQRQDHDMNLDVFRALFALQ